MINAQKRRPVIGFTLDYEESGGYSSMPWYALRENYCACVSRFGALPLPLPHEVEKAADYAALLDGLIITGGAFDVSPALYGQYQRHATVATKDRRTAFELSIARLALEKKIPILGICGGQQLLNVALGGTLIQHIPDSVPNTLEHEQKNPRNQPGHTVTVMPFTLLHHILTSTSPVEGEGLLSSYEYTAITALPNPLPQGERELIIEVNSAHHQAVDAVAQGMFVNAVAPDGVIEGIELLDYPFCLGVQWHPEYFVSDADVRIMAAFVEACRHG